MLIGCLLSAKRRHLQCTKLQFLFNHLIDAVEQNDSGTFSPSAFAALRFITTSKWVGSKTGRSAGFGAFQDSPSVNSGLAIGSVYAGTITDQSARSRECFLMVDGRNAVTRRQRIVPQSA